MYSTYRTTLSTSMIRKTLALAALIACLPGAFAQVNVLTNKYNNERTGQNTAETLLTLSNVNSTQFGKQFAFNVDGYVQAQPLYMSGLTINGAGHNVLFVATQHDSVYAIDADTGALFWQVSFINPAAGINTVPMNVQGCGGVTKFNEVGILSTPVIDSSTGTIYVVAKTQETVGTTNNYYFRLHALDVTTGAEKLGGPVVISGSSGALNLNSKPEMQRPALLLSNGTIYIAFGSNGCDLTGRGWLLAYSASSLQQLGVMTTQPDGTYGSSIWQGGTGPAADSDGNVYLSTANGTFDLGSSFPDLGDSILKLNLSGGTFNVLDYFTPFDQASLSSADMDLGSAAVAILPDQSSGPYQHLLATGGKRGDVYLLNRDDLGQYNLADNSQIPDYLPGALSKYNFGSPSYWTDGTTQYVYYLAHNDFLKAYSLGNGTLSSTPIAQTTSKLTTVGLPEISGNGTSNGVVWIVRSIAGVPLLSAYEATHLYLLYDSGMAANNRDSLGTVPHFATPTIANGRVYAGTQTQVVAYGLFPQISITAGNNQTGYAGTTLPISLTVTASNPYTGVPVSGLTITFSDNNKGGTFGSTTVVTDSTGKASTTYKLPNKPQTLTITAGSPGFSTATFTEQDVVGPVAALSMVSGGKQTGTVGSTLPLPIVIKAKDAVGNNVPNATITFSSNWGGSFNPPSPTTDSTGQVSTVFTLPIVAKTITVTASSGTAIVHVTEQSVAGPPAMVLMIQGNNQQAHINNRLPKMLIVSVTDQYGNGLPGLTVNFSDNGAGGTFTNPNPVTTTIGQASTGYTTPNHTGVITITATYGSLPPVVFTETVI